MAGLQEFKWHSCGSTHVGNIRSVNEDAFLNKEEQCLWAVADGMGGHSAGDVASQTVVEELAKLPVIDTVSEYVNRIEQSLLSANNQLINYSREILDSQTVGSTVVGMISHKNQCVFFWVGDSRLYRFRNNQLVQLTEDHTEVNRLVRQGILTPEQAEAHPDHNTITRAVGAESQLFIDFDHASVQEGDIFLLSSDGLDKELSSDDISDVLAIPTHSLDEKLQRLINLTLERGARDNVTIVLVEAKVMSHNDA